MNSVSFTYVPHSFRLRILTSSCRRRRFSFYLLKTMVNVTGENGYDNGVGALRSPRMVIWDYGSPISQCLVMKIFTPPSCCTRRRI